MAISTRVLMNKLWHAVNESFIKIPEDDIDIAKIPTKSLMDISAELIKLDGYDISCLYGKDGDDSLPRAICDFLEFRDERRKDRLISIMIHNIINFYEECIETKINETADEIRNYKE